MIELVNTRYGILKAVRSNAGYSLFRGVPYAKPPVGDLRWKAPEEPEKWEGVRLCDRYGDACAQFDRWSSATDDVTDDSEHPYIKIKNYPYPPNMSEDCLYLNIYTPAESKEDRLPVMIYIHGGGLQQWYGSDYEYCGDNFCKNGCILISVTYRLNIFGFFVHPELARESGYDTSGNYGIMDQIQALKWVYENIEGFGGDPDNITVFGQSAGGRCSLALACSPLSRDMVRRISVQSAGGIGSIMADFSREKQEKMGLELMQSLNCSSIAEMRKLKWEVLRDANDKLGFFDGFNLYTDGYVIPEDIDRTLYNGSFNDIDIIIGCTVDEGANERNRCSDQIWYLRPWHLESDSMKMAESQYSCMSLPDSSRVIMPVYRTHAITAISSVRLTAAGDRMILMTGNCQKPCRNTGLSLPGPVIQISLDFLSGSRLKLVRGLP